MSQKKEYVLFSAMQKKENKLVLPKQNIQKVHNGVGHIYVFKMILLCIIK
jgi:hypothetical protein